MLETARALILEHDKVWVPDDTPFRTFLFHHSMLINRLNNAHNNPNDMPDAVKADRSRQRSGG